MRSLKGTGCAVLGAALAAGGANAGMINIFQDDGNINGNPDVTFDGTLEYVHNGGNSGTLNISLTNTTAMSVGGFITGFVFNAGGASVASSLSSTTNASFLNLVNPSAMPFGTPFLGGAALGANWEGGGNPSNGIAIGQTASFVFAITGADAGLLSSSAFLEGPFDFNFIVRFRGLADGGSSKAPAAPAPGAAALGALALAVAGRRRR